MKLFENKTYTLLPYKNFKLYADAEAFPAADSAIGTEIIENANKALAEEVPHLYASVYRRFVEDGNRTEYENAYFDRRTQLRTLLLGEIIENKGRYTDKIIDCVWLMLEETSWIIPAHNHQECSLVPEDAKYTPLPLNYDSTFTFIDLFSAETGALLSMVYYFLKDKIDEKVAGIVNDRILYAINERILAPFLRMENMWWMGKTGKKPNNWNPWILSNVLLCCACTEINDMRRSRITHKALRIFDAFIDNYGEDGGCNEGPHYWSEAAGGVLDVLEILDDMTDGKADVFASPLVRNMFDYIRKVHLCKNYFTSFADSAPELYKDGLVYVLRMAKKTDNALLYDFAAQMTPTLQFPFASRGHNYRIFKNLCTALPKRTAYTAAEFDHLEQLQVAVWRKGRFHAALKGGSNAESHNHNDVGNVIVYYNEKPVLIDIGWPTYTKDLFSSKRYTVFPTASEYHNVPEIGGCRQKVGAGYCADSFVADANSASIEYTSAYGDEKVRLCKRELQIGKNGVSIHEQIQTDAEVLLRYFTATEPVTADENTLYIGDAKIIFSGAKCNIIPVPLEDQKIIDNWKTDTLWQIQLTTEANADVNLEITGR